MLSVNGFTPILFNGVRRLFFVKSYATPTKRALKSKVKNEEDFSKGEPHDIDPYKFNSPESKVLIPKVKEKILEILDREGPMSRRDIFDKHLSKLFPTSPLAPNPPIRPIWMRDQYTPTEEKVYLTMNKYKRHLIKTLVNKNQVAVMTVYRLKKLISEVDKNESREEVLRSKVLMERCVENEKNDKTFVWVLERWVTDLKHRSVSKSLEEARITGRPVASRFKAAYTATKF
ncbi:hypothetical protein BY996DRAFT_2129543 [Phakopsora pachyrhizi]|uniref:Uncharacterized protein n=1 Tax=Phakopsora pachyrhizi TaxID=170000 RepID=A0AAV0BMW6_PHAPC|nr:hypothetical protein BY996DRAFT_2129543 [Phakopsora pachyrhizi]CAH7688063.1 hypothetical protein PPACK8108_LOCUS22965 [Phakopsora pachyrhizi]